MKKPLIALIALAAVGAAYIYAKQPAPTYTPPTVAAQETIPTVLADKPTATECVRVLDVKGMCCAGCPPEIHGALVHVPGVRAAAVDFDTRTASVIVGKDVDVTKLEAALTFDKFTAKARP
jgi:copper chaperone CopZ